MLRILTIILFILFCNTLQSQTVVLKEEVNKDTVPSKWGKNRNNFIHFFIGYGLVVGTSDKKLPLKYIRSDHFDFGLLYKRRICQWSDIGMNFSYNIYSFKMDQVKEKVFPDSTLSKNERIEFFPLSLAIFHRLNYSLKRGNDIGKYMDLGFGLNYNTQIRHTIEINDGTNDIEISRTKLKYVNAWFSNIFIKMGFKRFVFYTIYRLDPLIKNENDNPDLPKWVAGLEFSFF